MADNNHMGSSSFRSLISNLNSLDSDLGLDFEYDQPNKAYYYE